MTKPTKKIPDAGQDAGPRSVLVGDVMTSNVRTVTRHQTVGHVRELLADRGFHSTPVVDSKGEPIGMITATDLLDHVDERTLIGKVMTKKVYTVPQYSGVHVAARVMRNHKIHHVVVTHEKRVVGLVSTFDILRLVEDKRFVPKNASTPRKGGRRKKTEG